jgi:hypothetical protein
MGAMESKPDWIDSVDGCNIVCKSCSYCTNEQSHIDEHNKHYHPEGGVNDGMYVYYMDCNKSIDGRNELLEYVDIEYIDCTGGQAAFEYNPNYTLQQFGNDLVRGAREKRLKLGNVLKMFDPGLGLDFPMWWVEGGIRAGVFERFKIPDDVQAQDHDYEDDDGEDEEYESNMEIE